MLNSPLKKSSMAKQIINVLLVEDNPGDARLIFEMLNKTGKITYTVKVAENLSSAVFCLTGNQFDIIILDLNLPDSTGLSTLDLVLKNINWNIPVLVLTGLDDDETGISAIEHGAEDYLIKNEVNSAQLIRSIRYAIERKKAVQALRESERRLKEAQSVACVGDWDFDRVTQKITWSDQVYIMYERDPILGPPSPEEESDFYTPEQSALLRQTAMQAIETGNSVNYEFKRTFKSGRTSMFAGTIRPVKDQAGNVIKIFGTIQDITERNKNLEDLRRSLEEKKELISEIYHRTKNNLQVIISMFTLQSIFSSDKNQERVFKDMENRIRAMSLVHEKLYQSRNMSKLDLKDYLLELTHNIMSGYGNSGNKISIIDKMENMEVLIDTAIPCGLVFNELVTNVARHAFPGDKKGELEISLVINEKGKIELVIADNGAGKGYNKDIRKSESMGFQIISNIIEYQLQGEFKLDTTAGMKWTILFNDDIYEERI